MMKKIITWFMALFAFVSCDYDPFAEVIPATSGLRVLVDWRGYDGPMPQGMTLFIYNEGGVLINQQSTNNISSIDLRLGTGKYKFRLMNQSPSEFNFVRFREMSMYKLSEAFCPPVDIRSTNDDKVEAAKKKDSIPDDSRSEVFVDEPEELLIDNMTEVVVRQSMLDSMQLNLKGPDSLYNGGMRVIAQLHPEAVTENVTIAVKVKGIKNLRKVEAVLTNMAPGAILLTGESSNGRVSQYQNSWQVSSYEEKEKSGIISSSFTSFGLPLNHRALPTDNYLKLTMLLIDGKTVVNAVLPVGNLFQKRVEKAPDLRPSKDPHVLRASSDWIIEVELGEALPDVPDDGQGGMIDDGEEDKDEGAIGGGAFDVTFDEWGDPIEENIVM